MSISMCRRRRRLLRDHGSRAIKTLIVQDLKIQPHNTCYRLKLWQTPDGEWLRGNPPATLDGGHFGPELHRYVL